MKPKLNTTPDGGLACAYGTPWLDHFAPPIGTGKGCVMCEVAEAVAICDHKFVDSTVGLKCGRTPPTYWEVTEWILSTS